MEINGINIYRIVPVSKLKKIEKKGEVSNLTKENKQNPSKQPQDNKPGKFDEIFQEEIKKIK